MTDNLPEKSATSSQILLYQTEDGHSRIEVRLENETVWLSQKLLAELFQKDVRTINEHVNNIYTEGELEPEATIRKFRIVQTEGGRQVNRSRQFTKTDIMVAKNYLSEEELSALNLIVSQYLDFAELQARGRKPMYMADWKSKLDAFLTVNDQDILTDAGRVSAQLAKELSESEFEKYQNQQRKIEADTANEELNRTVKRILQKEREKKE